MSEGLQYNLRLGVSSIANNSMDQFMVPCHYHKESGIVIIDASHVANIFSTKQVKYAWFRNSGY